MKKKNIKKIVRQGYARIAVRGASCCAPKISCCGPTASPGSISKKIGYKDEELDSIPEESNMGLGCGNPLAIDSLKAGETVLDLGSGAGMDCFLASSRVGKKGKVIGIDMTPEMLARARRNAVKGNYKNVEFRQGEIEDLPVGDNTVDVIISNCVINLSPDKEKVFKEAFRVLRPGGRLMVSDIVLLEELPEDIANSIEAYVGCLAGAVGKDEYLKAIKDAGFKSVKARSEASYPLELMISDPGGGALMKDLKMTDKKLKKIASSIASIKVYGVKKKG
ncbi:MAG: arsenite methyltransferase [Deltaproteobacteria bacterium]